MIGYAKLHRCILSSPICTNGTLLGFYCFLLLKASHKARQFYLGQQLIDLKESQLVVSQKKLSEHFSVSISTINRRLQLLKKQGLIQCQGKAKYTLVTMLAKDFTNKMGTKMECGGKTKETIGETNYHDNNDDSLISGSNKNLSVSAFIQELKRIADRLNIVYQTEDEQIYAQKILSDEDIASLCKKQNCTINEFCEQIMRWSLEINYWKGPCAGPKAIYENYIAVCNKHQQSQKHKITDKTDEYIYSLSDKTLRQKLLHIKQQRTKQFPYKKPFASLDHLKTFITAIQNGEL